jgi:hypothetical protein
VPQYEPETPARARQTEEALISKMAPDGGSEIALEEVDSNRF